MKEFINFFSDKEQAHFRKIAQLQNERFESTLDSYADIFILNFNKICNKSLIEDSSLNVNFDNIITIQSILKEIKLEDIAKIFKSLKNSYLNWLKSKSISSVLIMEKLVKKYFLLEFKKDISNMLLYRGRWENITPFNKFDMFHIPYDKRYLISNQRYSLPGIPFLYFGTSIYDVMIELGVDEKTNDWKNIYCSYFYINKEKYDTPYEVFDLTNPFYDIFSDTVINTLENKSIDDLKITRSFFKFIIGSVCSFEKTAYFDNKNNSKNKFYEEYILPQILTQVLIKNKLKGVMYSSTKLASVESETNNVSYKNNIALFTDYNPTRHYDVKLYQIFNISHPIKISENLLNNSVSMDEIISLANEIEKSAPENITKYFALDFRNNFVKIKIGTTEYFEHIFGKVELFLIFNCLLIEKNKILTKKLHL